MAKKKTVSPSLDEQDINEQTDLPVDAVEGEAPDDAAMPDAEPIPGLSEDDGIPAEESPTADEVSFYDAPPTEGTPSEDAPAEDSPAEEEPTDGGEVPDTVPADTAEPEMPDGADAGYGELLQELGESALSDGIPHEEEPLILDSEPPARVDDSGDAYSADDLLLLSEDGEDPAPDALSQGATPPSTPMPVSSDPRRNRVLTIDARSEVQTEEDRKAIVWHEIQNSHWTRRILTGTLDGVEKTESGLILAVVNYKGFRVAIPIREMLLYTGKIPSGREYIELMDRLQRILNTRLGAEIDFIVKGHDNKTRSVVASRKDAMYKKRQTFYMDTNELGEHLIYEGRVVQARVVAVAEKIIRVEVFGVECAIVARGLSWEWIGNAHDHFSVGDRILVRVLKIDRRDIEHLSVQVDVRSVSATSSHDNLKNCLPQCRYVGRVTDVRNGVVFVRLNNGVNAIAHTCYDMRYPGKKDDVSFAVTRIDEEQGVAIGIITRIIKQNL